jgi:hypothetical protein
MEPSSEAGLRQKRLVCGDTGAITALVESSRAAQGLPPRVSDPVALTRIAALLAPHPGSPRKPDPKRAAPNEAA